MDAMDAKGLFAKVLVPLAWTNELEYLPYKAYEQEFQSETLESVIDYLLNTTMKGGDETVEPIYEKEVFYPGEGWQWEETIPSKATRCSLRLNSEIRNKKAKERVCVPVSEFRSYGSSNYGGYKDYS
jgi:hypothetical protein